MSDEVKPNRAQRRADGWRGDISLFVHAPRPWYTRRRRDGITRTPGNQRRRTKAAQRDAAFREWAFSMMVDATEADGLYG